jgi:multidrug efflux pump subunit AcrB
VLVGSRVQQEVFPDFKLDIIAIRVPYPGASPEEVERGIVLAVEEAVRGVEGVDRVTAIAAEDAASVYVNLELDTDRQVALADVKNAVDRLTSLPEEAERPVVSLVVNRFEVVSFVIYGDQDVATLRALAERTRDELLADETIANVDIIGAPPPELAIEVPQAQLRALGMTLDGVANIVAGTALDVPGGSIETDSGEVRLRTNERRHDAHDFSEIPLVTGPSGTRLLLGDIATVRRTFTETDESAVYDGQPAVMLRVYRTGEQTPIEVADAVSVHLQRLERELPAGVSVARWTDWSTIFRERIDLLLRNAAMGLCLVMLILGLFLEIRLAFWVTMGIPISFLGALLLMPMMDVSINMISLFAFIVVLGMVVDDAIVVGENVFELRQRGMGRVEAAIAGVKGVAVPVCFAVGTTMVAFSPMLFVPGISGKLYRVIPSIVISVLAISLIEALIVLPAHLAALKDAPERGLFGAVHRQQQKVARGLETFIKRAYAPFLRATLHRRYVTLASAVAIWVVAIGWVAGGHTPFRFMPVVDGDLATASLQMPFGTSVEQTEAVQKRMLAAANEVLADAGEEATVRGIFSQVGTPLPTDPNNPAGAIGGSHVANVQVFFHSIDDRPRTLTTSQFLDLWREKVGRVAGAERLQFSMPLGPSPGAPVDVELVHDDMDVLDAASTDLATALRDFQGVWDIDDGFTHGKPQLDLKLTPTATSAGLTVAEIARQVRGAFYGAEALRQQEGRYEMKVLVRLPESERRSVHDVETLLLRTPSGGEMPLVEAAHIEPGRSWPYIRRTDGHRMVEITADVKQGVTSPGVVVAALEAETLPGLLAKYPGLRWQYGGAQREQSRSVGSLLLGGQMALLVMFGMLAIPFRSYVQPLIVMAAIPFGLIGALIGHILLGFDLSMISMMGVIALTGVVVNDAIVLIDAANEFRRGGMTPLDAIYAAGVRRFRPILLTSSTTFFGLTPMIFETSVQARFLVPMAVSLGFGVAFATSITLVLIPSVYMMFDDIGRRLGRDADAADAQPTPTTSE